MRVYNRRIAGKRTGAKRVRIIRVYVDTSVIGGCFDKEFAKDSQAVMRAARDGGLLLLLSDLLV